MMKTLYENIVKLTSADLKCALCTLINTRGSTPQDAGAKLLVFPDGKTAGTIGGGCVEAEVRKRALQALDSGVSSVMDFVLDHDFGWDDGLICGGKMEVFVDVLGPESTEVFAALIKSMDNKAQVALGCFVSGEQTGQKFWFDRENDLVTGLDDPETLSALKLHAEQSCIDNRTTLVELGGESGTAFLEPHLPKPVLLIAGAGHVGQALAHQGKLLGFEVIVIDDRESFANHEVVPDADRLIVGDIPQALRDMQIDESTYVVVVTRGHLHDQDALYSVVERPAAYIGLIGSRRKVKMIFDEFRRLGVSEDNMARVYAPIGLDIASITVPEIALSIAAQLVLVRRSNRREPNASDEQVVYALRDRRKSPDSKGVSCPQ